MVRAVSALLLLAFVLPAPAQAVDRAPRAAKEAAKKRAAAHFGGTVKATFTLRSQRDRRWSLVTGDFRNTRLWAAWVQRTSTGRYRVRIFRTRAFDPGPPAPCDIRPAFAEPACPSARAAAGAGPSLRLGSSQRSVEATPGSGCFVEGDTGGCADVAYPLALKGTLIVRRGHRIALDFGHHVDSVQVTTPAGPIEMTRDSTPQRWFGTLPQGLPDGFARIGVSVRWGRGSDQHYEAGLHVLRPRTGRVRMPKVTGLPQVQALLELERRGIWWRFERAGPRFFDTGPPVPPGSLVTPGLRPRTQSIRPGTLVRRGTAVLLGLR